MPRVVHFEISADKPERAITFYQEVFGWKIEKWDGPIEYWMVMTGDENMPGIDGGLMIRQNSSERITNTIDVPDIDLYLEKVEKAGGSVYMPKSVIPGVGYLAYFKDTEGNVSGIMQSDPSAK